MSVWKTLLYPFIEKIERKKQENIPPNILV